MTVDARPARGDEPADGADMASGNRGKIARGALVSIVGQWGKYVVQIAAVAIFSRLLAPEDIGLVTAATALTGVAWVLSDFGLSLAGLQADELSQDQKSMLFWANSAVGLVITLLAAAVAPLISMLYDDPRLTAITLAGSICFLFSGITGQFQVAINRQGRFGVLSAVGAGSQAAGLAVGVVVVLLGGSYWGLVAHSIASTVIQMIGMAVCSGWWPSRPKRGVPMRHLYRFGGQTLGVHLVTYVTYNADSVAIARVLGNSPLGYYNRAYQLSEVPTLQLASPLTKVFLPALSQRRKDPVAYADMTGRIQLFLGYVLAGGLAFMLVEGPAVVRIALGPGWDPAVPVLQVLCLAAIAEMLGTPYYWTMLSWARTGLLFWVELGPRVVTIALIIVLVPYGIVAVAWAVVAGQVLALILGAVFVLPAAGLRRRPFIGRLLRPMLATGTASGATALVLSWLPAFPAPLALLVGGIVWLATMAVLALLPMFRADLAGLLDGLRALRSRKL